MSGPTSFIGFVPSFPGAASTPNAQTSQHLPSKGDGSVTYNAAFHADLADKHSKVNRTPNPERNPFPHSIRP